MNFDKLENFSNKSHIRIVALTPKSGVTKKTIQKVPSFEENENDQSKKMQAKGTQNINANPIKIHDFKNEHKEWTEIGSHSRTDRLKPQSHLHLGMYRDSNV